jgi:PadR family transcriptional regulator PadR
MGTFLLYYRISISKFDINMKLTAITHSRDQELLSGLIRIHILYHACQEPIFGLAMIEELQRHGYKLSAGTLYPMLHGLESRGLLRSRRIRLGPRVRRVYRATAAGKQALKQAKEKVKLLLGELLE